MSDFHWPGPGYSPVSKLQVSKSDSPIPCSRCGQDLRLIDPAGCSICAPEIAQLQSFKVQLPRLTLEIIKAKHKNVSAYLRGLIAKDLGPGALPESALNRPGAKLKVSRNI